MSQYVLNPLLLITTSRDLGSGGVAVTAKSSAPPLLVDDERLLWALLVLEGTFTEAQAKQLWSAEPACADVAEELWSYCLAEELIVEEPERPQVPALPPYHYATRSHPFLNMEKAESFISDNDLMKGYQEEGSYPGLSFELLYSARVKLSRIETIEGFNVDSVGDQLSMVFDGTFGVRARLNHEVKAGGYLQMAMYFKSIPSGGSRHPTECFVHSSGLDYLVDGMHYYNPAANALDAVRPSLPVELLARAVDGLDGTGPRLTVLLVSAVERAMWRYRESRSLRAVLVDVGHAEQMMATLAQYVGWVPRRYPLFDAAALSRLLPVKPELPVMSVWTLDVAP